MPGRDELRDILASYMRRKALTFEQADQVQREAESLLAGSEFEVDSMAVQALVRSSDCSACDYAFIALAPHLKTKLVTMDAKLLRAFPDQAISLAAAQC